MGLGIALLVPGMYRKCANLSGTLLSTIAERLGFPPPEQRLLYGKSRALYRSHTYGLKRQLSRARHIALYILILLHRIVLLIANNVVIHVWVQFCLECISVPDQPAFRRDKSNGDAVTDGALLGCFRIALYVVEFKTLMLCCCPWNRS